MPTNFVEFWSLNGSLSGRNGNVLASGDGADHFVAGKIGQAWDAGGVANRVLSIIPGPINPAGGEWSVSWWVYFPLDYSANLREHWRITDGTTRRASAQFADVGDNGDWDASLTTYPGGATFYLPMNLAAWNHLCLVFRLVEVGVWEADLYANGTLNPSETGAAMPALTAPRLYVAGSNLHAHNQPIDSFGLWTRALSASDVAELYAAGAGWEPPAADATPDAFAFTPVADANTDTPYTSDSQVITGMDAGTAVSISGDGSPQYRVDGGEWTSAAGTIDPGQTLELRATSSAESEGVVTVTVTVGSVSVQWTLTTAVLASVVTTILWGGTPDRSRILSSRIVRGVL